MSGLDFITDPYYPRVVAPLGGGAGATFDGDMNDNPLYNLKRMSTVPNAGDIGEDGMVLYESPITYDLMRTTPGEIDSTLCEDLVGWAEDGTYDGGTLIADAGTKKYGAKSVKFTQDSAETAGMYDFNFTSQSGLFYIFFWHKPGQTNKDWSLMATKSVGNVIADWGVQLSYIDTDIDYYDGAFHEIEDAFTTNWDLWCLEVDVTNFDFDAWLNTGKVVTNGGWRNDVTPIAYFVLYVSNTQQNAFFHIDELSICKSGIITVNDLPTGWYFKVKKGANTYTSTIADGTSSTLDCRVLADPPPYDEIEIYDDGDNLILDNKYPNDVFAGDIYSRTSSTIIRRLYLNVHGTVVYVNL